MSSMNRNFHSSIPTTRRDATRWVETWAIFGNVEWALDSPVTGGPDCFL